MTCGFGCGSCVFSRPRPAGDEWDLWSLPLDLSLLPYEILPAAFTISFRSLPLPSCCWIGVPEVLPFSLPDFWAACGKSSSGCRSVHDGTLLKSLLESGFAWSSYLLISGCFLSVTILYHSPKVSSIRRANNPCVKYLCILRIDQCMLVVL